MYVHKATKARFAFFRTRMRFAALATMFTIALSVNCAVTAFADDPKALASEFVEHLVQREFNKAAESFNTKMRAAMPVSTLERTWHDLLQTTGEFVEQTGTSQRKHEQYDIVDVTCQFEKANIDVRVVLDKQENVAGLFFRPAHAQPEYEAPDYVDQSLFDEVDVEIGSDPWQLPGTLSLPRGDDETPAVILVHGSGPQDRDETIGPNKPFRDLAGGLASAGIAVLRYDKRTNKHKARFADLSEFTVREEVIADVFEAVEFLRRRPRFAKQPIIVLGHSLGGYLIPRIAADKRSDSIDGFVIMAGNTRPLEELIQVQTKYLLELDGALSAADTTKLAVIDSLVERIRDPELERVADEEELLLGVPISYWLDLRDYSATETAKEHLQHRTLFLQGESDYQVTMEDFAGWQRALKSKRNVMFKSYGGLHHLFMECDGMSTPTDYEQPGHVAPIVIRDVSEFVRRRPKTGGESTGGTTRQSVNDRR